MPSRLRSNHHSIITLAVLLIYGSGGVLGYGLHKLLDCEHCSSDSCSSIADNRCLDVCCSHSEDLAKSESGLNIDPTHDDCPVCALLAQAQSPNVVVTIPYLSEPIDCSIPVSEEIGPLYVPRDHFARGPPTCRVLC